MKKQIIIIVISLTLFIRPCFCHKAFINAEIFTGTKLLKQHVLIIENGKIIDITKTPLAREYDGEVIDLNGMKIIPGFIDLQVNGGGGLLFNNQPTIDGIKTIVDAHHQFGTVAMLPTLISDKLTIMQQAINAVDDSILAGNSAVLGIHLEGPFLAVAKKGIHDPKYFKKLEYDHIPLLTSLKNGKTIVTLAPETTELDLIKQLSDAGIKVFAGHTNASYEEIKAALNNGLWGFTHLYNAMSPLTSRSPNVVGAALEDETSYCGIINDGYHIHPAAVKIAIKAKTKTKTFLVTDSVATVGATNKQFKLQNKTITEKNGKCVDADGVLGGSALTMIDAVKNTIALGFNWQEAVRMASLYPAECIGVANQYGKLQLGYIASFVVVDADFNIQSVWLEGNKFQINNL